MMDTRAMMQAELVETYISARSGMNSLERSCKSTNRTNPDGSEQKGFGRKPTSFAKPSENDFARAVAIVNRLVTSLGQRC